MKRMIFCLCVMLAFMSFLICCTGSGTSTLVGKWIFEENKDISVEFFKDGSGIWKEGSNEDKFTWTATESGSLSFVVNRDRETFDYKISGPILTLTMYGVEMRLRKKKMKYATHCI